MSDQILELGLSKRRRDDGENIFVRLGRLLSRFISLLSEIAVEGDTLNTGEFRFQLERYQSRLNHINDTNVLVTTAEECLARCQDYFRRAQNYLGERETEIGEVVTVLREAVGTLTGESAAYNKRLTDSTDRFKRLTDLEDLRELKRMIACEVNELARILTEKRKEEEALYAKMSRRFDQLQERLRQTKQEGLLDPLTQVGNRRSFERAVNRAIQESMGRPLILAIIDLDDFKNINDRYGHQVGDQALINVARWLNMHIRSGDFLGRYGGDEFVILLTNTTLPQVEIRFLQLLAYIAAAQFEFVDGKQTHEIHLTVSCGLAEYIPGEKPTVLVHRADKALYKAKKRGKNCVVSAN